MCRKGLIFLCLLLLSMMAQAQPVLQLKESRISVRSARARHLLPHYGLPMRSDGQMSVSVNRIESLTGCNLFTTLPSHLQEIVEEMTSAELFCPFQEFDSQELPERDLELEFEVEHDDGLDQW